MKNYSDLSPEAREQVDATVWLINHDITPLSSEKQGKLKDLLANLVLSCYAADGKDAWKRMYYDLTRRFEGESLTDKQIAEKAQTHREFLFQEGQLRG